MDERRTLITSLAEQIHQCLQGLAVGRVAPLTVAQGAQGLRRRAVGVQCNGVNIGVARHSGSQFGGALQGAERGRHALRADQVQAQCVMQGCVIGKRIQTGAQHLFDLVANAMIEKKQDDSPVGYFYM